MNCASILRKFFNFFEKFDDLSRKRVGSGPKTDGVGLRRLLLGHSNSENISKYRVLKLRFSFVFIEEIAIFVEEIVKLREKSRIQITITI